MYINTLLYTFTNNLLIIYTPMCRESDAALSVLDNYRSKHSNKSKLNDMNNKKKPTVSKTRKNKNKVLPGDYTGGGGGRTAVNTPASPGSETGDNRYAVDVADSSDCDNGSGSSDNNSDDDNGSDGDESASNSDTRSDFTANDNDLRNEPVLNPNNTKKPGVPRTQLKAPSQLPPVKAAVRSSGAATGGGAGGGGVRFDM